jgi:hypothetical protein
MMHGNRTATCWNCGEILALDHFGRHDDCPKCHQDTRVCKNCFMFDPLCYNACKEIQAERVVEKEEANFCDFFKAVAPASQIRSRKPSADASRQAAEALFKTK